MIEKYKNKNHTKTIPPFNQILTENARTQQYRKSEPALIDSHDSDRNYSQNEDCENIRKERDEYKKISEHYGLTIENLKTLLLKEKEINLNLQMVNEDYRVKFAAMEFAEKKIQDHFQYLERNMSNYEYITHSQEAFLKLETQKIKVMEKERKKMTKEKAKTDFEAIDARLSDMKNLLKNSGSEECKSLHKEVIAGMADVQKSLLGLKFEVVESHIKLGVQNIEIEKLNYSMSKWKKIGLSRKESFVRGNEDKQVLILKGQYAAENKELSDQLHKQGAQSPSFNYLQEMPQIFRMGLEGFNQKLEALFQNLHFTTEHNLFEGWLQALRDFVGKSVGETAVIERWLRSPLNQ